MDSLGDIAVFVRVVKEGSFTQAADRLEMSRSVVSKYVTRLEERLGVRLMNRTTRRLSLTEAGQVFYERSCRGLREFEEAEAEVSHLQEEPRGILRINSPMSFGIHHVAPVIPQFLEENPGISIDMNLDDRKLDVIKEGFDVSIRISDMPDSALVARRLGPCRHVVVAAPSYLVENGTPKTPEDLSEHNIISYRFQESVNDWHFTDPENRQVSVTVSGALQMNNSLALREALLGGAGIMRTPTFVVGQDITQGRLVKLFPGYQMPEPSIYLVFPQRRHLSPKVRAFVDFMAARITANPYWDEAI